MNKPNFIVATHSDWDKCRKEILVYLDGFKDQFAYAITVTDEEYFAGRKTPETIAEKINQARDILYSDWEKAGCPR